MEKLNFKTLLGEGNLIFCCTGSRENYFGLVCWKNNNNPKFQRRHIYHRYIDIDHQVKEIIK